MRIDGTLTKWNDDRGFGFITPTQVGPEVFVHISSFPRDGQRPRIGERLTFEIEIDKEGKKRAKNLRCPSRSAVRPLRQQEHNKDFRRKPSFIGLIVPVIVIVVLAAYGYGEYSRRTIPNTVVEDQVAALQVNDQSPSSVFRCDGRTHCSQMTSCAEAEFFLKNCPDVKMDGNNDGVPCEKQWCTGL